MSFSSRTQRRRKYVSNPNHHRKPHPDHKLIFFSTMFPKSNVSNHWNSCWLTNFMYFTFCPSFWYLNWPFNLHFYEPSQQLIWSFWINHIQFESLYSIAYADQMEKTRFVFKFVQAARSRKSKKKQTSLLSSMTSDTMSMDSSSTVSWRTIAPGPCSWMIYWKW